MSSIVAYNNTPQTQYHIIICVCCSFVILLILHIVCIEQKEPLKIVKSYKDEFKPHCTVVPTKSNRKKIIFNPHCTVVPTTTNRKKIIFKKNRLNNTTYKCNGIRRNGSTCRQDGTKSGGEIINGYCNYHKKMRK